jgi:hypothetical protein
MMMRGTRILLASLVLLALAAVSAVAADVNVAGTWTMKVTTPRGERTSTLIIVQDGEKLTVTSKSERGDATGAGTLNGDAIEWSITRETPMGQMTFTYKGKVEGDTMSGTTMMRDTEAPWSATRDKQQ